MTLGGRRARGFSGLNGLFAGISGLRSAALRGRIAAAPGRAAHDPEYAASQDNLPNFVKHAATTRNMLRRTPAAALALAGGAVFAAGLLATVTPGTMDAAPRFAAGAAATVTLSPVETLRGEAVQAALLLPADLVPSFAEAPDATDPVTTGSITGAVPSPASGLRGPLSESAATSLAAASLADAYAAEAEADAGNGLAAEPSGPPAPVRQAVEIEVESGDTLGRILASLDVPATEARAAVSAMSKHFKARDLRVGQTLTIEVERVPVEVASLGDGVEAMPASLLSLSLAPDEERTLRVLRDAEAAAEARFETQEIVRELTMRTVRAEGSIEGSLFAAASRLGVPSAIMIEFTRLYSYSVDFQREIRKGDTFEIYYTEFADETGETVRTGDILYASLKTGNKPLALWRFEVPGEAIVDYFDENGRSSKKFLMRTPIDGARISSSFGKRRHPILGYTKMHTGTDFAAPTGTPIYAAGSGVIEKAGWNGGYGKYVLIRHANGYKTAYAHMSRIERGITPGARVTQGQTIGRVGTTGRSTGPHLHYEVHVKGKKVNPMAIRVPTGRKLEGNELAAFRTARDGMNREMAQVAPLKPVTTASADEADTDSSVE